MKTPAAGWSVAAPQFASREVLRQLESGRPAQLLITRAASQCVAIPDSLIDPCRLIVTFEGSDARFELLWRQGAARRANLSLTAGFQHGGPFAALHGMTGALQIRELFGREMTLDCEPGIAPGESKIHLENVVLATRLDIAAFAVSAMRSDLPVMFEGTLNTESVLTIERASETTCQSDTWASARIVGEVQKCSFRSIELAVDASGSATEVTGQVRLAYCHGDLYGTHRAPIVIEHYVGSAAGLPLPEPLQGGRLVDFGLPRRNLRGFVRDSVAASVVDPGEASVRATRDHAGVSELSIAEALYDMLKVKAERQSTVASAGYRALNARRRAARPWSGNRLALNFFYAFGYGRRLSGPLVLYTVTLAAVSAWRWNLAVMDSSGILPAEEGVAALVRSTAFWNRAIDFALSISLLPFGLLRDAEGTITRLHGGYLLGLRVLCGLCLAFIATSLRGRVRLTPRED